MYIRTKILVAKVKRVWWQPSQFSPFQKEFRKIDKRKWALKLGTDGVDCGDKFWPLSSSAIWGYQWGFYWGPGGLEKTLQLAQTASLKAHSWKENKECLKGFCVARQSKSLELNNWYWNVGVSTGEPDVRDEFLWLFLSQTQPTFEAHFCLGSLPLISVLLGLSFSSVLNSLIQKTPGDEAHFRKRQQGLGWVQLWSRWAKFQFYLRPLIT